MVGRFRRGAGEEKEGGGITSDAVGSLKVRFSSALPSGRASSRKLAGRPCFQKFVTWENWCCAKAWAVGDQGAWAVGGQGAIAITRYAHPGICVPTGVAVQGLQGDQPPPEYKDPGEASTESWQWAGDLLLPLTSNPTETLQPLKKCYQAV